jgi:hypothetical protein
LESIQNKNKSKIASHKETAENRNNKNLPENGLLE